MSGMIREILNLAKGAWLVKYVRRTSARIIWLHVFCFISPILYSTRVKQQTIVFVNLKKTAECDCEETSVTGTCVVTSTR